MAPVGPLRVENQAPASPSRIAAVVPAPAEFASRFNVESLGLIATSRVSVVSGKALAVTG